MQRIAAFLVHISSSSCFRIVNSESLFIFLQKTSGNPLYHTVHDNFWWMSTLIDPEFKYHQVTTRIWTQITMTLADAVVLPLNVTHYGENMKVFNTKIRKDFATDFKNYNVQNELGMS